MPGMFYPLGKRSDELMRILKLTDRIHRENELIEFVTQEKAMLISMTPPRYRSKALDTAKLMLQTLQMENTLIPPPLHTNDDNKSHVL